MEGHLFGARLSLEIRLQPIIGATTMAEDIQPNPILTALFDRHFTTDTSHRSTHKSTLDVYNMLADHAPGKFTSEEVFDMLQNKGFVDKVVAGELMWTVGLR